MNINQMTKEREELKSKTVHPDNATWQEVLEYLAMCAAGWETDARLVGNARAVDILMACRKALSENDRLEAENEYLRYQLLSEPTKEEQAEYKERNETKAKAGLQLCPSCNGSGVVSDYYKTYKCTECNGNGSVKD